MSNTSESGKPKPLMKKLWHLSLSLFAVVLLLTVTWELAKQIWWVFLIIGLLAAALAAARWWWRRRQYWD